MKRYIKSDIDDEFTSQYYNLPHFNIDVDVYFDMYNYRIASAKDVITPYDANMNLNPQALEDYLNFIVEAELELEDAGLVIVEKSDSNSTKTSKYYTLADKSSYEKGSIHWVIFLRISDHLENHSPKVEQWIKEVRKNKAESMNVRYKPRSIVINNDAGIFNYDQAIDRIVDEAHDYSKVLRKGERRSQKKSN